MSKSAVKMSPADVSSKWKKNYTAGIPDAVAGVERVTESPMEKAIQAEDKMKANLVASIDNGTWRNQLQKVSLPDWKTKTAKKLRERGAGGAEAAMPKRQAFDSWMVGTLNGVLPEIAGMPDLTLEDSKQRMIRLVDYMADHKYKTQ